MTIFLGISWENIFFRTCYKGHRRVKNCKAILSEIVTDCNSKCKIFLIFSESAVLSFEIQKYSNLLKAQKKSIAVQLRGRKDFWHS